MVAAGARKAAECEKPYSANEELAKLEAMSPHPGKDGFARRLSVKHDRLIKELTEDLGLNAAEEASVKTVLDARLRTFRAALETGPKPGNSPEGSLKKEKEMLAKAGGIIRGAGLRENLVELLSDGQLAAFDEREEKIRQTQVESHAYRELAKLTPVLELTEEQKDKTFELLQTSSAEKLDQSADARAFMALRKNQSPTQMEMTDLAEAEMLTETFDGSTSPFTIKRDYDVVRDKTTQTGAEFMSDA